MPSYDYRCDANGRVLEVSHKMNQVISTWGELCDQAGITPGETPPHAPVVRLVSAAQVVQRSSLGDASAPACERPSCCGGGCGTY